MNSSAAFLHIAPENCLEEKFRRVFGSSYITADLMEPYVDRQIDVTNIPFDDNSFDAIYCSHVLEHVPDDAKALKEFYRILKPSGWALPVVPITAARTIEDPSVTEPAERLRLFGQEDHVRRYGPDYADRLQCAGFSVTIFDVTDLALPRDVERMGLAHIRQPLHFCSKP